MSEENSSDLGVHTIEGFFGVYLLVNESVKYKGRTYIGFTVDPNRREKQHNKGTKAGGAHRTSNKGPWEMVLIVHGFPNEISALRFEWAWTYPKKSRRLRTVPGKLGKETCVDYRFRVLSQMLSMGPWKRLPLTIRWLNQDYKRDFPTNLQPPIHMPIEFGPVNPISLVKRSNSNKSEKSSALTTKEICQLCGEDVLMSGSLMKCLIVNCSAPYHIQCLAAKFLGESEKTELIPVEGECPVCQTHLMWGDLIIHKNGGYAGGVSVSQLPNSSRSNLVNLYSL